MSLSNHPPPPSSSSSNNATLLTSVVVAGKSAGDDESLSPTIIPIVKPGVADPSNDDHHDPKAANDPSWKSYDPTKMTGGARYSLCISAVVPRPVGVLTTINPTTGIVNCAPFSYTSISSHDPPIVTHGLCLTAGGTKKRDTLVNIEANGQWVFNVLTEDYLELANACSAPLPYDMSEIGASSSTGGGGGLTTTPSIKIAPPRLVQSPVSMECQLLNKVEVRNDDGVHTTTIVMGRVIQFHIHDSVLKDGRDVDSPLVDLDKVKAVGRAGDITYWPVGVADGNTNDDEDGCGKKKISNKKSMKRPTYNPPAPPQA